MSIIELLSFPFVVRALVAGTLLSWLLATMGVFLTLRKQAFLADGIAHASLLGVAIGLLFGAGVLWWAVAVAVGLSIAVTYLQTKAAIEHDSAIGVTYTVLFAMALSLLFMFPRLRADLNSYLFGSILGVGWDHVVVIASIAVGSMILLRMFYSKLVYMTFDRAGALVRGIQVQLYEYVLNALLAIVVVVAIKLVGVILVTGLIVIPAVTSKLLAGKFKDMLVYSGIIGILMVWGGVLGAYVFNIPTGAAIVLVGGLLFMVVLLQKKVL